MTYRAILMVIRGLSAVSHLSWVTATLMEQALCLREGASGQVDECCLQLHLIHILGTESEYYRPTHE